MLENYFGQRPTQAEQQRLLAVQAALELVQATSVVSGILTILQRILQRLIWQR